MKTDSVRVDAGQWKLIKWSLAELRRRAGVEPVTVDVRHFLQLRASVGLDFLLRRLEDDVTVLMASDRKCALKRSDRRRRPGVRQRMKWDVKQRPSCHYRNICSGSLASFYMGAQTDNAPSLISNSRPQLLSSIIHDWLSRRLNRTSSFSAR